MRILMKKAQLWTRRASGFCFTVVELCALGAFLGAILFPLAGELGGILKPREELIVLGVKSGGFIFMVWAPGIALVREFWRAGRHANL